MRDVAFKFQEKFGCYGVFVDGRPWATVTDQEHAETITRALVAFLNPRTVVRTGKVGAPTHDIGKADLVGAQARPGTIKSKAASIGVGVKRYRRLLYFHGLAGPPPSASCPVCGMDLNCPNCRKDSNANDKNRKNPAPARGSVRSEVQ